MLFNLGFGVLPSNCSLCLPMMTCKWSNVCVSCHLPLTASLDRPYLIIAFRAYGIPDAPLWRFTSSTNFAASSRKISFLDSIAFQSTGHCFESHLTTLFLNQLHLFLVPLSFPSVFNFGDNKIIGRLT